MQFGSRRILIVDDEPYNIKATRHVVKMVLEQKFNIREAETLIDVAISG